MGAFDSAPMFRRIVRNNAAALCSRRCDPGSTQTAKVIGTIGAILPLRLARVALHDAGDDDPPRPLARFLSRAAAVPRASGRGPPRRPDAPLEPPQSHHLCETEQRLSRQDRPRMVRRVRLALLLPDRL